METLELTQGTRKPTSFRLTPALIDKLDEQATQMKLSRTELVERYLIQGLLNTTP